MNGGESCRFFCFKIYCKTECNLKTKGIKIVKLY